MQAEPKEVSADKATTPPAFEDRTIYECTGCGTVTRDRTAQMALYKRAGALSCCPERNMVPVKLAEPAPAQDEQQRSAAQKILDLIMDECRYWHGRDEARRGGFACLYAKAKEIVDKAAPIAQTELVEALQESERFIAGFEGCELQEGIDALLAKIRAALAAQGGDA